MSLPRFYIEPDAWNPEAPVLDGAEAHHCIDVMRLRQGDGLIVFDGRGHEIQGTIAEARREQVVVAPRLSGSTPPLPTTLTLVQAIPKGKNMDLIVQKATELGVDHIVPVVSQRTVVRIDPDEAARKQAKWQRVAIEASKQCGQNWLPAVHPPRPLEQALQQLDSHDLKLIAALESDARPLREMFPGRGGDEADAAARPASALICIGPEGDFTPAEANAARALGCQPVSLGPIILRTETAAIYCLAVLNHELRG